MLNEAPEHDVGSEQGYLLPLPRGWALECAARLDRRKPGFLTYLLRSKPTKRHAILAVLGQGRVEQFVLKATAEGQRTDSTVAGIAGDLLIAMKPREIIEAAFGYCPDGLLGAFERMPDPLKPDDYLTLVSLLGDHNEGHRQRTLRYISQITSERLHALLALNDVLCATRIARKTFTRGNARTANDVLAVVRAHRPDLTDSAIVEFSNQADGMSPLESQLERLLTLVEELPPAPIDVPGDFIHLRTRSEFQSFGIDHRHCLATKFEAEALTGRAMYWVYRRRPAVVVLLAVNGGWMLGKVHCPRNSLPPLDLVEEVRARLAAAGAQFIVPAPVVGPLATVRRLLMRHDPFALGSDETDVQTSEF